MEPHFTTAGTEGSYELLFHETGLARFRLGLGGGGRARGSLGRPRPERAIGVIYRPETERHGHYFRARLASQFDCVPHSDETRAVEPLEPDTGRHAGEEPTETFPSGV